MSLQTGVALGAVVLILLVAALALAAARRTGKPNTLTVVATSLCISLVFSWPRMAPVVQYPELLFWLLVLGSALTFAALVMPIWKKHF